MPKDNFDTSPGIIVIRNRGDVRRLNMELALSESQNVPASGSAGSGGAGSVSIGGGTVTGGIIVPRRIKDPDEEL